MSRLAQILWRNTITVIETPVVPIMMLFMSFYDFLVNATEEAGYLPPRLICCHVCLCMEDHRLITILLHQENIISICLCYQCITEIEREIDKALQPYHHIEVTNEQNQVRSI